METKLKIYFAHPMDTYNTIIEEYCIEEIKRAFPEYEIENPNTVEDQLGAKEYGMEYFKKRVLSCDAIVALAFPDETIGAGVGQELIWAEEAKLPSFIFGLHSYRINLDARQNIHTHKMPILSVEETRIKLRRNGWEKDRLNVDDETTSVKNT